MSANVKIIGATNYATSCDKTNTWASALQIAGPVKVFNVVATVNAGASGDRIIYLFDLASGVGAVNPRIKFYVFKGGTGTLEFGAGGAVFPNGCYIVISADDITDGNTAPSLAAAGDGLVSVDYRTEA